MSDRSRTLWIVFNGEIYNFIELRAELIGLGHTFGTQCDTEVILEAYQEWGAACLSRFRGMWAFTIVDLAKREMFCARDPFGIKPFYYSVEGKRFTFASEIKALLEFSWIGRKVNPQALNDFLRHGLTGHGTQTMFESVRSLEAGACLRIPLDCGPDRLGEVAPTVYWKVGTAQPVQASFMAAKEEVRSQFLTNIQQHLRSDVPIGAALSGGIDSSSIVSCMHHVDPDLDIRTFTYAADDPALNEEGMADEVVRATNARSRKIRVSSTDLLNDIDSLIYAQDEPFISTSVFAQSKIFQCARANDVVVMLDGQGADEILGGYPWYIGARLASAWRQADFGTVAKLLQGRWSHSGWKGFQYTVMTAGGAVLPQSWQVPVRWISGTSHDEYMQKQWFRERGVMPEIKPPSASRYVLRDQLVKSMQYTLPMLLRYEDRNSMRYSIESRVPFLVSSFVDYVVNLPEEYLITDDGETKHVFRAAMSHIVPQRILSRRDKLGFVTPEEKWLRGISCWVDRTLSGAREQGSPIALDVLTEDWVRIKRGEMSCPHGFWKWINCLSWAKTFELAFE